MEVWQVPNKKKMLIELKELSFVYFWMEEILFNVGKLTVKRRKRILTKVFDTNTREAGEPGSFSVS